MSNIISEQLQIDAEKWIADSKYARLLYTEDQLEAAKEYVRLNAVSTEIWEFIQASICFEYLSPSTRHEIRKYSTSVRGYADLLYLKAGTTLEQEQYLIDQLRAATKHLQQLFDPYLNFAPRIEC